MQASFHRLKFLLEIVGAIVVGAYCAAFLLHIVHRGFAL